MFMSLAFYCAKHIRNEETERKDKTERKEEPEREEEEEEKNFRALFLKHHSQIQNLKDLSFYLKWNIN